MKFLAHLPELLLRLAESFGSFLVFAAGVVLLSVGAFLVLPAAGLITAGLLLVACAIAYERTSS